MLYLKMQTKLLESMALNIQYKKKWSLSNKFLLYFIFLVYRKVYKVIIVEDKLICKKVPCF